MHDRKGSNVYDRYEKVIEITDLLSKNLNKKLEFIRIGADVPHDLAEEHARLTARLSELRSDKASNGATAAA